MSTLAGIDGARIVVLVNDVDMENRLAHCQDKTKATIKVGFRDSAGGAFRVPAPGERWTAIRTGPIWRFDAKLDSPTEHLDFAANMDAGDTRIDSGGTIHVLGDGILFNGQPVGATTYSVFTANAVTRAFTLPAEPVHFQTVQAFINGLLIDPRSYSVSGAVVTFLTAPASGTLVIYYQRAGFVYEDSGLVRATGIPSGPEFQAGTYFDAGTGIGIAVPSAVEAYTGPDIGTAIGIAVPSAVEGLLVTKAAGSAVDDASVGTKVWSNPANVTASDDVYATSAGGLGGSSHFLRTTGHGFAIPGGATITGIEAQIERHRSNTVSESQVKLALAGVISGSDRHTLSAWSTTDTVFVYGGPTDLWGLTLTPADVNDANFGVAVSVSMGSTSSASVDQMTITVYYT